MFRPKLVATSSDQKDKELVETQSANPFANLDALRNPQDYEEFLSGEAVSAFAVRTLKEGMFLRVNPDPNYSLYGQYTVATRNGTYFVYPQIREALGPLPRRCNLHIAVDGHGEYFLILVKQPNPGQGQEDNAWYTTARTVAAACGQLGKQANCQVAVTLSIANHHASLPIAYRLYLPKDWADDAERRNKAHVPEAIRFKTKPQIALAESLYCRESL